jgi:hypothetical protein
VAQHNPKVSGQRINLIQHRFIKAGLFNAEAVRFGSQEKIRNLSGVIGRQTNLSAPWLLKDHRGICYGHAILVHNREENRAIDCRRLRGGRNEAAKEK